ncbi:spermidine synthase [Microbacterium gorillae]|uniref:spermidine synthase n=1 Tax=Microbacterium gorillae TaxID=1231063 RepID=UPI003D98ACF7
MARRSREEPDSPRVRLSDGTLARVARSEFTSGWELLVDETPQSHVDLDDPTHLHFEYIARIGAVIDVLKPAGEPLTAVHLGGGALTVPRYIAVTRPDSRQQVIELEPGLWDLVRENLPLPRGAAIRVRIGDARAGVEKMPGGILGQVDLVVSDVFAGAQTPAHVTSVEFYTSVAKLLAADGVVLVNVADGPGLAYTRRQIATLRQVLPHVAVLAEAQVLKGRRFGNLVLAASRAPLPTDWLPRLLAAGPHPAKIATDREVNQLASGALPVTDADAVASPRPNASIFDR